MDLPHDIDTFHSCLKILTGLRLKTHLVSEVTLLKGLI